MPNENPIPENNNKPGRLAAPTLIQAAFPEKPTVVFFTAIVIGLLLIAMTIAMPTVFRSYCAVNYLQLNLLLCLGVGLVLAAFGGQATVRIGGIIMAGVAAVTLGLFIYLQYESRNLILQGTIEGFDYETYKKLAIQKELILGRTVPKDNLKKSQYEFVIFKKNIDDITFVTVALARRDKQKPEERELRVHKCNFERAFGGSQKLEWELREEGEDPDRILTLVNIPNNKTIAREGELTLGECATTRTPIGPILINAAFAQERSDIDVPLMLERLKNDDTATRRGARDALSQAPVEDIPTIMETFRKKDVSYREKLGICVALAEMLRADKHRADAIRSKLNDADLNLMLDAAGDPDRTVRVYAAEFLYDLEDTRTTKLAIPRAAETSDDNARYNWVLVGQGGWLKLTPKEKADLDTPLEKAKQRSREKPKTLLLFDKYKK